MLQVVNSGINYIDGKQLLLLMQLQGTSGEVDPYVRGRGRRMIKIGTTCIINPITLVTISSM